MKINKQKDLQILFIGKENDFYSEQAAKFTSLHFPSAKIIYSLREKPLPEDLLSWKGDLVISYLSQWIIPKSVLQNAKLAAINFHPGPPEYPGIGCTNFAIYNNADEFGVTCHHMNTQVDTGDIIAVKRFPVYEKDTVYSLTQNCYGAILNMFYDIFYLILDGKSLPKSEEIWKRKPYLRKQLNELCRLTPDMNAEEAERRIKATNYLQPWAFVQIGDKVIKLTNEDVQTKKYLSYLTGQTVS